MAVYDFNSLGGGMAPSEPAASQHQPLPLPPMNIPGQFGSFLGALGGFGLQAMSGRSPQQMGDQFSDFGSSVNSGLSSLSQGMSQFEPLSRPQPLTGQGFLESGLPPLQLTDPNSALFRGAKLGGALLNTGLKKVEQFTAPSVPGDAGTNPLLGAANAAQMVLDPLSQTHEASILAQGVGNFLQDTPQIDKMLLDSFRQGASTTFSNDPDADQKNHAAVQQLTDAMGKVTDDLFDPKLMNKAIYDGFRTSGADHGTAQSVANMLAEPITTLSSFFLPGSLARVMLVQFVGNLVNHPSETVESVKQAGGHFFNLLGTTANWISRGGKAPTTEEVSLGLTGLADSIGTLAMAHGMAHEGFGVAAKGATYASEKLAARNLDRLQRKAAGESPTGADEISNAVGQAALDKAAMPDQGILGQPEFAGVRNAAVAAPAPVDAEFASHAEELGAKVHPPNTLSTQRSGSGFMMKDGSFVELPHIPYYDHGDMLEDMGIAHFGNSGSTAIANFVKDTGAISVKGRTDFTAFGLDPNNLAKIGDELRDMEDHPQALAMIEDVKTGKAYSFSIEDLKANEWNVKQTLASAQSFDIPKAGENGTEDIQQTPQASTAGEADQASQFAQTGQASAPEAASGADQGSATEGAFAPSAQQANQGLQGENLPASNVQPSASPLEFVGGHAEGIPNEVRSSVQDLLHSSGINSDGFVSRVLVDHEPGVDVYGSWSPFVDPRMIHLDLPNMGSLGAINAVHTLRQDLTAKRSLVEAQLKGQGLEALRRQGITPESAKQAFDEAERVLTDAAKNLRPDTLIQWIAGHEALHATLGKIYDYPPGGKPDDNPLANGNLGRLVEGVHMISHMDSTPEGKAWLDHAATQMGLKGEVGQLRMLARQAGDLRADNLYDSLGKALTGQQQAKIGQAETFVNEALVHAVQTGKGLTPYPYLHQSGDKAHAISFFNPEKTQENARLAAAYYDKYRSEGISSEPTTTAGASATGLPAGQRTAARFAERNTPDQARLEAERQANRKDWEITSARIADDLNFATKNVDPGGRSVEQIRKNLELVTDRIKTLDENPGMSVRDVIKLSNERMRATNPEIDAPKAPPVEAEPAKITAETAQSGINQLKADRENRGKPKQRTLAEINQLNPPPDHYTDKRLTEADRNRLIRHSVSQINQLQRALKKAEASGDRAKVDELTTKLGSVGMFWKKFLEDRTSDTFKVEKEAAPAPVDYTQEAGKIASYGESHALAPLKDLASSVVESSSAFDRAREAGASPTDLADLQGKMQWDMTRFRAAHDLYTSDVFKTKIDKQGYDWRQTRKIANRVAGIKGTPNEKAKMVARLLGEQVLKRPASQPYTLADAGEDLRKTAMGISKVAKNWHPEVKKALAGELWNVARQGWQEDPTLPLGVKNIPIQKLLEVPDPKELADALSETQKTFNDEYSQFRLQRDKAKVLESAGKLARGTVKEMERQQYQKNLQFSNERLRLQSLIDNHPQTASTRAQNFLGYTREELAAMPQPSIEAAREAMGENPGRDFPIEQLIADAEALNARIAQRTPNPFSVESFLDEMSGAPEDQSGGRSVGAGPNNGKPWFTPGWAKALTDLREMGGNHSLIAELSDDLLKKMGDHLDPSRSMFHPVQWFRSHWEAIAGIPYRVHQIQSLLSDVIAESKDPDFSKAILRSIDDQNIAHHLREIGTMSPEQAKLAIFLNEYWKTVREQFKDPQLGTTPLIGHFVDNYVPHVVLKDPDGNALFDTRRNMWSRKSGFAKERIQTGTGSEPVFKTLEDLESKGYTVEWDLSKVFAAHANSTFRMMKLREMFNTLRGNIYNSPDGKFSGFPIVHMNDLATMKKDGSYKGVEIFDSPGARVRFGPGDSMFQQYRVHPELARFIERLASSTDMNLPGMAPARFLRSLGGIFKFVQFSINPRHAFNVFSNVANLHSPLGFFSPNVWTNIYGRANRAMLPADRSGLYKRTHAGDTVAVNRSLRQRAVIERNMRDVFETMQREGFDPADPMPTGMTAREADLRDRYAGLKEQLMSEHRVIETNLATRDRQLLATLMDKGLVPDRDLIEGADLNKLSNITEKIPGMREFHRWMWHDVVWRGQIGTAMHLADQFTMKAAQKYGWNGKGGAAAAEKYIDPDLLDSIQREAVYTAKQGTAILNKLDMSSNWQLYGRATLLSAPWTLGQLQAARDAVGNNKFSQLLGHGDFTNISDKQLESGFGKDKARFLDDMHTKLARRMVYAGTAKLMMTSMVMSTLGSYLLTGQANTPIQNFLRDPMHTFDIYAGRDPATGNAIWIDSQLFGFQHELINYALAGVKAAMERKGVPEIASAPFVRFLYKDNPMINLMIDMTLGKESRRYLAGLDPGMESDQDLQNLHGAVQSGLDKLGIPDFGGVEDRLLYAIRVMAPSPGGLAQTAVKRDASGVPILDEMGNQIPLTDPRSLLNDFGIGGFFTPAMDLVNALPIPNNPVTDNSGGALANLGTDLGRLGTFAAGTSMTVSNPLYNPEVSRQGISMQPDPHGFFPEEAKRQQNAQGHEDYMSHELSLIQIGKLAAQGTPEAYSQIAQIRDQNGLTDSQVVNAITHSTAVVTDNNKFLKSDGIVGKQPASGIVTVNGRDLTEAQSVEYNKTKNNRQLYAIQQLQNSSIFKTADSSTKMMLVNQAINLSDKFTAAQAGQAYQGIGGQPLKDSDFKEIVKNSIDSRGDVQIILQNTPEYAAATPNDKLRMQQSYASMADTIAWDKQFGDLKNLTNDQTRTLVINSVQSESQALSYLKQTPFYQNSQPEEQAAMEKEYSNLAKQMNINIYNGKTQTMNPVEVPMYMRAVVNTEETSKYLLHQSDFYTNSSLAQQQSLDRKYANYSRSLALKDWQSGQPILNINQAGQSFSVGPEQLVVGHLMAEQGYNDLMNQYGGSETITAYQQQLSDMKKQIKENIVATPKQLNRMQTILAKQFEAANPQYAAFLKARTAWERGSSVGRLYLALNADEQALATADTSIIADSAGLDAGDILDQSIDESGLYGSSGSMYSDLTPMTSTQSLFDTLPG